MESKLTKHSKVFLTELLQLEETQLVCVYGCQRRHTTGRHAWISNLVFILGQSLSLIILLQIKTRQYMINMCLLTWSNLSIYTAPMLMVVIN